MLYFFSDEKSNYKAIPLHKLVDDKALNNTEKALSKKYNGGVCTEPGNIASYLAKYHPYIATKLYAFSKNCSSKYRTRNKADINSTYEIVKSREEMDKLIINHFKKYKSPIVMDNVNHGFLIVGIKYNAKSDKIISYMLIDPKMKASSEAEKKGNEEYTMFREMQASKISTCKILLLLFPTLKSKCTLMTRETLNGRGMLSLSHR